MIAELVATGPALLRLAGYLCMLVGLILTVSGASGRGFEAAIKGVALLILGGYLVNFTK